MSIHEVIGPPDPTWTFLSLYYKREDKKSEGRLSADTWRKAYYKVLQENRLRFKRNVMINDHHNVSNFFSATKGEVELLEKAGKNG